MFWLVAYDRRTYQIESFVSNSYRPPLESDIGEISAKWKLVRFEDPPFAITRDHKFVTDAKGNIVGTEESRNPVQPEEYVPYMIKYRPHMKEQIEAELQNLQILELTFRGRRFAFFNLPRGMSSKILSIQGVEKVWEDTLDTTIALEEELEELRRVIESSATS